MSLFCKSLSLLATRQRYSIGYVRSYSILSRPPVHDANIKTIDQVIEELTFAVTGSTSGYNPEEFKKRRQELAKFMPSSQDDLPARHMLDSFDEAIIPLGSSTLVRDRYSTYLGGVRIGRLLEVMDVFAVHLVFKHCLIPNLPDDVKISPFSIVTALVDKICIPDHKKINHDQDIKVSGHVTWVGTSSAESSLVLEQKRVHGWEKVTEASFVMVARDPTNTKKAFLNKLIVETDEEKALFEKGTLNTKARKDAVKDSLFITPPSEEEKILIHDFFTKTVDHTALSFKARVKPENSVWMEDAKLKNIILCQPEHRNRFNKIFGGFIMRQAIELAWANAYIFSKERPYILFMDDISFEAPVELGSLLYFSSQIAYVQDKYIQVRVSAEVLNPYTGEMKVTNVFHYTFEIRQSKPSMIIPKTYHEAMMYLNSRRHFLNSFQT